MHCNSTSKRLIFCGIAVAIVAGLNVAPASANSLAEYYRSRDTMKFCNISSVEGDEDSESDVDQSIRLPIDQKFIDVEATSEDVAPIFEALNAEYNAAPEEFCKQNTDNAEETIEEIQ